MAKDELSKQKALIDQINSKYEKINTKLAQQLFMQQQISNAANGALNTSREAAEEWGSGLSQSLDGVRTGMEGLTPPVTEFGEAAEESADRTQSAFSRVGEVFTGIVNTLLQVREGYDNLLDTISANVKGPLRSAYSDIQSSLGGITTEMMKANKETGAWDAGNEMARSFTDVAESVNLATYGFHSFNGASLPFKAVLGDTTEMMQVWNEIGIKQGLINGLALSSKEFQNFAGDAAISMRMVQKGLGLTAEETSTFVQREISLTGKAGTKMLTEVAVFSKKIAGVTKSSAKLIGKSIEGIISNTETFGNVTVAEAARISGVLIQVGVDYEDLGQMVNRFIGFEQAAQSVSALTTVFGVQLDAMEMMRLANTDQETFLLTMRRQFIQSAKSVDQMTLAEKRLVKSQLGLKDIESVERLLDPRRAISSMADLTKATAGGAAEIGEEGDRAASILQALGSEMVDLADITEWSSEKIALFIQDSVRAPAEELGILAEQVSVKLAAGATGVAADALKGALESAGDALGVTSFQSMVQEFAAATASMTSAMDDFIKSVIQKMKDAGLIKKNPPSLLAGEFKVEVPKALAFATDEMKKFTKISADDLKKLVGESGSAYHKMARHIGYLGVEYDRMDVNQRQALASKLRLGEDWEKKLKEIMKSDAARSGQQQRSQEDYATRQLKFYREQGSTLESLGGAEGDWAKAYSEKYGLTAKDLAGALTGGSDIDKIVMEAIGEKYGKVVKKDETKAAESEDRRKARIEEIRGRTATKQVESLDKLVAAISKNLTESQTLRADIATYMSKAAEPMKITVNLDGEPLVNYAIDNPNHSIHDQHLVVGPEK